MTAAVPAQRRTVLCVRGDGRERHVQGKAACRNIIMKNQEITILASLDYRLSSFAVVFAPPISVAVSTTLSPGCKALNKSPCEGCAMKAAHTAL
jgi:hypothetical protein